MSLVDRQTGEDFLPIKTIITDISHPIGICGGTTYYYAGPSRAMAHCLIVVHPSTCSFVARFKLGTTITLNVEGELGTYKITDISPQTITLELIEEDSQ